MRNLLNRIELFAANPLTPVKSIANCLLRCKAILIALKKKMSTLDAGRSQEAAERFRMKERCAA